MFGGSPDADPGATVRQAATSPRVMHTISARRLVRCRRRFAGAAIGCLRSSRVCRLAAVETRTSDQMSMPATRMDISSILNRDRGQGISA
ncbi:hypothetical protein CNO18_03055 [Gordonia sp. 1D]|nr:hypothetical protein CNO18_03055 [Gordonia sp. 1D]